MASAQHRDAHGRLVPQGGRTGGVDAVGHLVGAGRGGRQIAQHPAGGEGERVAGRLGLHAGGVEARTTSGRGDVVVEHRDVDLRARAHRHGVVDGDRRDLGGRRQEVDGRLAAHARSFVVGAVADGVVHRSEQAGAAVGGGARDAQIVLPHGVDGEGGPLFGGGRHIAEQEHAAGGVGHRAEHVEGRVLLRTHEGHDGGGRQLRRGIGGEEGDAGGPRGVAAPGVDGEVDAVHAGLGGREIEHRAAADHGRRRGGVVEDADRAEGDLPRRAGHVGTDVDGERGAHRVDDGEGLHRESGVGRHADDEGLGRGGPSGVGDGDVELDVLLAPDPSSACW